MTRPHGYARYRLDGCRCNICGWARAQYDDNRTRAIHAGTWQPWVDAEPVRIHVRHLQSCNMGLRTISARASVDRKRLQALLYGRPARGTGPQEKVRPALAAAVLAVEPTWENLAAHTLISPVGTRRRSQALGAAGWPQHHLAVHLNMRPDNFDQMLARPHVLVSRALAVRTMYDTLWQADPVEHGATPTEVAQARSDAVAHGWAPAGAWDDDEIDDPEALPDWTGMCGTPEGYHAHYRIRTRPCRRCRDAYNAAEREKRRAGRALQSVGHSPTEDVTA